MTTCILIGAMSSGVCIHRTQRTETVRLQLVSQRRRLLPVGVSHTLFRYVSPKMPYLEIGPQLCPNNSKGPCEAILHPGRLYILVKSNRSVAAILVLAGELCVCAPSMADSVEAFLIPIMVGNDTGQHMWELKAWRFATPEQDSKVFWTWELRRVVDCIG